MDKPTPKLEWPDNLWSRIVENRKLVYKNEFEDGAPEPVLYQPNLADVLESAINERQRKVLDLRFKDGQTYKEIGKQIGVRTERVRQIIVYAISQLTHSEHYLRLKATPEINVVQLSTRIHFLEKEKAELEEQMRLLLTEREQEKAAIRNQISLDAPVGKLDISVRSETRLIASGINTVGKLLDCTEEQIRAIPKLGKVSFADIKGALGRYGYTLK